MRLLEGLHPKMDARTTRPSHCLAPGGVCLATRGRPRGGELLPRLVSLTSPALQDAGGAVFFGRLLPVVRTFISIPAGIARMNFWKFSVYTFAGSFPWSLGLAYGGFLLGENWEAMRSVMRPFDFPILAIIILAGIWFLVRRIKAIRAQ